jgi:hypothetical protein
MKAIPTWILIADGGQAYVIERKNASNGLKKVPGLTFKGPRVRSRDIGTDKPGRAFSSVGSKRAAYDDDKRLAREAEEKFLGSVVDEIDESLKSGASSAWSWPRRRACLACCASACLRAWPRRFMVKSAPTS